MLKAIETRYQGYRFRSRLEARWAVFFDTNRVPWDYEAQGYDLGIDGFYLPDFWLPQAKIWIEIKPECPTEREFAKAQALARDAATGSENRFFVYIACGTPGAEMTWMIAPKKIRKAQSQPWCALLRLCASHVHKSFCPNVHTAYGAARAARFEYGEHP